ncbi:MAG TPA: hypothetical protein VL147_17805 [Devosia sp.]|nr:hypothetical protein [Devosia sp.]
MIEFHTLPDRHPDLAHSPLLRGALLTLQYAQEHGAIGLTKTSSFKRVFVHWAVEHFDWPGRSSEEVFRYCKVVNEFEFPPLEVLHYLLNKLRLGRHVKGEFKLTKRGAELAQAPGRLFGELIPFFVLKTDHASYGRFGENLFGTWDVWLNIINVEADHGTTERALYAAFYAIAMIGTMMAGERWPRSHPVSCAPWNGRDCSCRLLRNAMASTCTTYSRPRSGAAP